jgi:hypothetical protein
MTAMTASNDYHAASGGGREERITAWRQIARRSYKPFLRTRLRLDFDATGSDDRTRPRCVRPIRRMADDDRLPHQLSDTHRIRGGRRHPSGGGYRHV